ncbi:uncharacterized protein METZ01_LOCUS418884, partial [marine metagenome]
GSPENTTPNGDTDETLNTDSSPTATIGSGPAGFFNGSLDEVRFYNRALIADEPESLYKLEKPTEPGSYSPIITLEPLSQTVVSGDTVTLFTKAKAKPAPTFTWQYLDLNSKLWKNISGGTTASITLSNVTTADTTSYHVIVKNSVGEKTSKSAKLAVLDKPQFTQQPADTLLMVGASAYIQVLENRATLPVNTVGKTAKVYVGVTGSPKLVYQWFKNGKPIPNAIKNKLSLKKVDPGKDSGTYSVTITNAVGEVTSNDFTVTIIDPVKITQHP